MQDDPKHDDIDDFDDDGLDPLDDEDDVFEDESWDELDDDLDDPNEVSPAVAPKTAAGEKTFLQKYFTFIVIGIVAVFAGLLFIGMSGGSKQQASSVPAESGMSETATMDGGVQGDTPPMPVPMQGQDMAEETPQGVVLESAGAVEPLMPLPGDDVPKEMPKALPDLGMNDVFDDTDQRKAAPIDNVEQDHLPDFDTDLDFSEDNDADLAAFFPEGQSVKEPEPIPAQTAEKPTDLDFSAFMPPSNTAPPPEVAPVPESMATADQDISMQLAKDVERLEKEKAQLTQDNSAIEGKIGESESVLHDLQSKLSDLQQKIKNAEQKLAMTEEKQQQVMQKPVSAPQKKAEPAKVSATPTQSAVKSVTKPASAVKTQAKAAAPAKTPAAQWVLRAAQPGKATIAQKGQNDLKVVEVGDSVAGLGRIQSVTLENGRWVVRGTQGSVSQ